MLDIIDVPRVFMRAMQIDWRPDWRGQSAGAATDGMEQIHYNAFARFVGTPTLAIPKEMRGAWRAILLKGQGRVNRYRMRMIDPVSFSLSKDGGSWRSDWRAYQAGLYVEPRPTVRLVSAAAAGTTQIVVDERAARAPVRIGSYLSHNDWPFAVTDRTGAGAAVTLDVVMLRRAIPANAQIDLFARGVFAAQSDDAGFGSYEPGRGFQVQMPLQEWITRP